MRINESKMRIRLSGVPEKYTVFLYDATCIIFFLEARYEPPHALLLISEIAPYQPYDRDYFKDPQHFKRYRKNAKDLYDEYVQYRTTVPYTIPVESYYTFCMIINRLRFCKNNWQFMKTRITKEQTVVFTPLVPKGQMPKDITHIKRGMFRFSEE